MEVNASSWSFLFAVLAIVFAVFYTVVRLARRKSSTSTKEKRPVSAFVILLFLVDK